MSHHRFSDLPLFNPFNDTSISWRRLREGEAKIAPPLSIQQEVQFLETRNAVAHFSSFDTQYEGRSNFQQVVVHAYIHDTK